MIRETAITFEKRYKKICIFYIHRIVIFLYSDGIFFFFEIHKKEAELSLKRRRCKNHFDVILIKKIKLIILLTIREKILELWYNTPNGKIYQWPHKIYQMVIKYSKWSSNTPKGHRILQMGITYLHRHFPF
jgi:hypothetical protein